MTERLQRLRASDRAAREAACTWFDGPLVLEAGAGTGKTAVLVARVLFWLLGPGWERAERRTGVGAGDGVQAGDGVRPGDEALASRLVERVVAITFTERAAAEMGERIAAGLARLANGDAIVGFPHDRLDLPAEQQRRRAGVLLGTIDRLVVGTIHAFCRRLLAAHPLEAGLHPAFAVDADGRALHRLVEAAVSEQLQQAYGVPGDPDLVALAARGFGPAAIAEQVEALAGLEIPPAALRHDPYDRAAVQEAAQRLRGVIDRLVEALRAEPAGRGRQPSAQRLIRYGEALAAAAGGAHDLERLKEVAGSTETQRLLAGVRAMRRTPGPDDDEGALIGALTATRTLVRCIQAAEPEVLPRACRVMQRLLTEVYRRQRAQGIVGFTGLLRKARDLLRDHPEVLARLRRTIDQLLVDEFQDTDPLQCELVRAIALQGDGPRPALLIVGDPKQSIYGWRQADLRAYDSFVGEIDRTGGRRYQLSVNFRSSARILEEVDRIIAPVMRAASGLQPRFETLLPACPRVEGTEGWPGPAVEHWISWEAPGPQGEAAVGETAARKTAAATRAADARRIEARAVAADLRRQHDERGVPWHRIAILQRTTTAQDTYLIELRRAGVPYAVERDRSYFRQREVIEVAALMRAIADPNDMVALVALLRSPMVGVPDAALLPLWRCELPRHLAELVAPDPQRLSSLHAAIDRAAGQLPDDAPGIAAVSCWPAALKHAVTALAELRQSLDQEPLDRLVERVRQGFWPEPLASARFLGAHRLANVERFFNRLADELCHADGGVEQLLRRLRDSILGTRPEESAAPGDDSLDAVRVMTIHKAKGLTFDQVYVVNLHGETGRLDDTSKAEVVERDAQWAMRLLGVPDLRFDQVLEHQRRVAAAEAVRTLYVALTRPRQRLVLAGRWRLAASAPAPQTARSHVDLLWHRRGPRPDLSAMAARGVAETVTSDGTRWLLCDGALKSLTDDADAKGAPVVDPEEARQEIARLKDLRRAAALRAHRPVCEAVSASARAATVVGGQAERVLHPVGATLATAVGTAVHRLLERIDLSLPVGEAVARLSSDFEQDLVRLSEEEREETLTLGRWWLAHLAHSPLLEQLRELAPLIVARELPVLLRPAQGDQGAVGAVVGTVDLLYRHPEEQRLVVVDYKTDRVAPGSALQARTRAHQGQGSRYLEAIAAALEPTRPPRLELWYLHPGIVDRVAPASWS